MYESADYLNDEVQKNDGRVFISAILFDFKIIFYKIQHQCVFVKIRSYGITSPLHSRVLIYEDNMHKITKFRRQYLYTHNSRIVYGSRLEAFNKGISQIKDNFENSLPGATMGVTT